MLRKMIWLLACWMTLGLAQAAFAWDSPGHIQIADIAWTKLTARTKLQLRQILMAGDPQFAPTDNTNLALRLAFRKAATFPDVIKGNRNTAYESIIDGMNRTWLPMPDPTDREQSLCKTWHYYDTPIRFQGVRPMVHESNALNALTRATRELVAQQSGGRDRMTQCWWLYWIEHLTGDLHQPLHCVSSYEFLANGDAGGNLFNITDPVQPTQTTRLHFYWDAGIDHAVKAESLPPSVSDPVTEITRRWMNNRTLRPSAADVNNTHITDWIARGATLADQTCYTGIQQNNTPSATYTQAQIALCKRQAVLAGYRLAHTLNVALGR